MYDGSRASGLSLAVAQSTPTLPGSHCSVGSVAQPLAPLLLPLLLLPLLLPELLLPLLLPLLLLPVPVVALHPHPAPADATIAAIAITPSP